jgi:hypothetical protein
LVGLIRGASIGDIWHHPLSRENRVMLADARQTVSIVHFRKQSCCQSDDCGVKAFVRSLVPPQRIQMDAAETLQLTYRVDEEA